MDLFTLADFMPRLCIGDSRTAGDNEAGRHRLGPAARVTQCHLADIGGVMVCGNFKKFVERCGAMSFDKARARTRDYRFSSAGLTAPQPQLRLRRSQYRRRNPPFQELGPLPAS